MKLVLISRMSFWKIIRTGKKTIEVGTMRRLPMETEAEAMPRALEVAKEYFEQHKEA